MALCRNTFCVLKFPRRQLMPAKVCHRFSTIPESSLVKQPSDILKSESVDKKAKFLTRADLHKADRIVVKLGSAVLTRSDQGGIALGRLASIVEQVAELHSQGKEVMIVSSGAVAFGKRRLGRELMMSQSVRDTIRHGNGMSKNNHCNVDSKSCAAVGQSGLVSLYESMFAQYSISTAQVLVSKRDLDRENRMYLQSTLDNLLSLSIVPIINTNDAVTPPPDPEIDVDGAIAIRDNDSLAARLAVQTHTDLLVLMSDVDGLFTAPPGTENSKLLHTFSTQDSTDKIEFGKKSSVGTGGMDSKLQAAVWSLQHGTSVVICNGFSRGLALLDIVEGRKTGTFFTEAKDSNTDASSQAHDAKEGSRKLQQLEAAERKDILLKLAELLEEHEDEIMSANHMDVSSAKKSRNLSQPLMDRLVMSPARLRELANGVRQVAEKSASTVGKVLCKRKLAKDLYAEQISVPIGVLLIIFESRPDCLPQIASLAIATGNGVVLKGGKESMHTNRCLFELVQQALSLHNASESAQLVESRDKVSDLIQDAAGSIDLIIPRGSSEMVRGIQEMAAGTSVPVLGHSEGICHVYVDRECSVDMATRVVQDAKCNYPAACNALETLLIHKDLIHTSIFKQINDVLQAEGVKVHLGPKIVSRLLFSPADPANLKKEYSGLECSVEIVDGVEEAVRHIHEHGSSHTDTIVTTNEEKANYFLKNVDSACVFHNASTRFADGQRLGLGAEVGVSTTRIHARGPVGAEGLLTYKWIVRGDGHIVRDFVADGTLHFDHIDLPVEES
uniref:Delta-1-pyrroline-5-carboxylate synthase n=1 Tax=Phallusia mammillata TaxID=59560 RepID=A0A6F9D6Y3_9ASCI|nr:delta-1-pyrroline-5-carboxylate synthase-like [Phallusia mammillata]